MDNLHDVVVNRLYDSICINWAQKKNHSFMSDSFLYLGLHPPYLAITLMDHSR